MLSFQLKFSCSVCADRQTDRQMDKGKTIWPRSFDAGEL